VVFKSTTFILIITSVNLTRFQVFSKCYVRKWSWNKTHNLILSLAELPCSLCLNVTVKQLLKMGPYLPKVSWSNHTLRGTGGHCMYVCTECYCWMCRVLFVNCLVSRVAPDLTISNPTRSGFGEKFLLFWDHRTICLMKLIASTMLSAAISRQYSSVVPLLCRFLPVVNLWRNLSNGNEFCFFYCPSNTKYNCEYTTTPLDRSAALIYL